MNSFGRYAGAVSTGMPAYCVAQVGWPKTLLALLLCLFTSTAQAFKLLDDATTGVWADSTLGVSARFGGAWKADSDSAWVAGGEVGTHSSKQFVGYRSSCFRCSAPGWMVLELAHWRTRSTTFLADNHSDYVGVSLQALFIRMGIMLPVTRGAHVSITTGVGLSY